MKDLGWVRCQIPFRVCVCVCVCVGAVCIGIYALKKICIYKICFKTTLLIVI